jgi:hypothetical protein
MKAVLFASLFSSAAAIGNGGPTEETAVTTKFYSDKLCTEMIAAETYKMKKCIVTGATSTFISNATTPGSATGTQQWITATYANANCAPPAATSRTQVGGTCEYVESPTQFDNKPTWKQVNAFEWGQNTVIGAVYSDNKCQTQTGMGQFIHTEVRHSSSFFFFFFFLPPRTARALYRSSVSVNQWSLTTPLSLSHI